jgi:hypothetical protein
MFFVVPCYKKTSPFCTHRKEYWNIKIVAPCLYGIQESHGRAAAIGWKKDAGYFEVTADRIA